MHELVYIAMGVLHPLDRFKTEIRFSKLAFYITNANNSAEIRISEKLFIYIIVLSTLLPRFDGRRYTHVLRAY